MKNKKRKIPHQRGAQAWIKKKNSRGISNKELEHSVGTFSNRTKKSVMKEKKLTEKEYYKRRSFLATVYGLLTGSIKWKKFTNNSYENLGNHYKKKLDKLKFGTKEYFENNVKAKYYKYVYYNEKLENKKLSKNEKKEIYKMMYAEAIENHLYDNVYRNKKYFIPKDYKKYKKYFLIDYGERIK